MSVKFSYKLSGARIIDRRISQLKNGRRALGKVAKAEKEAAQRRITTTKRDPDGRRWRPWAASTRKQRMRDGSAGRGLLYKTGRLLRSITARVMRTRLSIQSNVKYSQYLRRGTSSMPPREFLGWSRRSIANVKKIIERHIKG